MGCSLAAPETARLFSKKAVCLIGAAVFITVSAYLVLAAALFVAELCWIEWLEGCRRFENEKREEGKHGQNTGETS